MGENSKIEWTDATVNFWWGCTKVGPACEHCYAETWAKRTGGDLWGLGVPRRKIKSAVSLLYKLHNGASWWAADHEIGRIVPTHHRRVFIQSMSDLFDTEVPIEWFAEAWQHICACDALAIQIVTKRVSVVEKRLAAIGATGWPSHAGLMISVVNQEEADRDIPRLLALKAKLGIPWVGLSMEPLLGPVDLRSISLPDDPESNCVDLRLDALTGFHRGTAPPAFISAKSSLPPVLDPVDWVIVGGESGKDARRMYPGWVEALRDQCAAAGVPFLFKQWGEWAPSPGPMREGDVMMMEGQEFIRQGRVMRRVGKKAAGRLLDGVQHDGLPA